MACHTTVAADFTTVQSKRASKPHYDHHDCRRYASRSMIEEGLLELKGSESQ